VVLEGSNGEGKRDAAVISVAFGAGVRLVYYSERARGKAGDAGLGEMCLCIDPP
jgi:hypothetical protein